jgi:hypothetical protein
VVAQYFIHGSSHDDVKKPLEDLKKRFDNLSIVVKHWTTDLCCTDAPHLKDIFGQQLQVRLDIFHFMKRIGDSTFGVRHPAYNEFMQKLRECIFVCHDDDKKQVRLR